MQLKMETVNVKSIKRIVKEQSAFIKDVYEMLPRPGPSNTESSQNDITQYVWNNETKPVEKFDVKTKRALTIEDLQSKLNQLKGVQKLHYKDKLKKKNLKSKLTKKQRKNERVSKKSRKLQPKNDTDDKAEAKPIQTKPVFNVEDKMVFSKFDFKDVGKKPGKKPTTNPEKILDKMKQERQQLRELEKTAGKEKVLEIKEKKAWQNALAKAEGRKVKDDPELLKKSILKRKQQAQRSKKKWEARKAGVEKAKDERQKKRADNIQKRKVDVKNKKLKKAVKKGKVIPGF